MARILSPGRARRRLEGEEGERALARVDAVEHQRVEVEVEVQVQGPAEPLGEDHRARNCRRGRSAEIRPSVTSGDATHPGLDEIGGSALLRHGVRESGSVPDSEWVESRALDSTVASHVLSLAESTSRTTRIDTEPLGLAPAATPEKFPVSPPLSKFDRSVQQLRKDLESLDKYPVQQTAKLITLRAMCLQEVVAGRAYPVVSGVPMKDLLPPELQDDFDDYHAYSDFVGEYSCYLPKEDQYPVYFEVERRSSGIRQAAAIDGELSGRVRKFRYDALAQIR